MPLQYNDANGEQVPAFQVPASGQTTTRSVGAASAVTGALSAGLYRIQADTDCFIARGATATSSDMPLASGVPEYFWLAANDTVAAIQSTAGGTLYLTKVS